ncbi:MAG: multidrug transporter AcrB [Gemmataceae bacterium]|jgi:multidrug efflux pump subunit AcrB|nr:MAG: multidrug transporter AcrB [Gemmataceae bacterium]
MTATAVDASPSNSPGHDWLSRIVRLFLESKLSLLLILFSLLVGMAALLVTPREEDPQIVVPLADVYIEFPGHSAEEVEQLVATPLERLLYQIDGVEYVYSMSQEDRAIVTVRFYVGEDRERSLVKLFKKINENLDVIPPGVQGWVIKPVEIDDVPIVTLTLTGAESFVLRRVAEEVAQRLAVLPDVSRAYVIGGRPRIVRVELDVDRLAAYRVSALQVEQAIRAANIQMTAGRYQRQDRVIAVEVQHALRQAVDLPSLVVGVSEGRPVFLRDVVTVLDGPAEVDNYVRFGWGPAREFAPHPQAPGTLLTPGAFGAFDGQGAQEPLPAVTIAIAKKKGVNSVTLAHAVLEQARGLHRQGVIPDDIAVVVTRNYGLTADDKVNELIEALGVAILIVLALLTLTLGWRPALVVATAVPVVFGLTLAVNLLFGYSINRVTLFALIVALGLLVDDPIVDVENIARHFELRRRASHEIVLQAVAEIRPPLISATLAVIVSFLPLFFITGMMGPYMAPMALNVPVSMLMSMLVAFTITPWLSYYLLRGSIRHPHSGLSASAPEPAVSAEDIHDPELLRRSRWYRGFHRLMAPLLAVRRRSWLFLALMGLLTAAASLLAVTRAIPLKMLPYDNKNELHLILDLEEGTTLERTDAVVREFERLLQTVPEVVHITSYVGVPGPIDFNGLVRHYYLRRQAHQADIWIELVPKKYRQQQSHGIGLRLRERLTAMARKHGVRLKLVETPPGPPVLASVVAEITGRPDHSYETLLEAARTVAARLEVEPGLVDVDGTWEAPVDKWLFIPDQEKAALHGISIAQIADTLRLGLRGSDDQVIHQPQERQPLRLLIQLPRSDRSNPAELGRLLVSTVAGQMVPLAELGRWERERVGQTIYHKNLERIVYVWAETAGRTPAECILDVQMDQRDQQELVTDSQMRQVGAGYLSSASPRSLTERTFYHNGGGILWSVPEGVQVNFAGEGEWDITLDVFRDLGLAFAAAMAMIYVILVAQTQSFLLPVIIMLAIPLTAIGVLPGFYLLNLVTGETVGGYADPVYFTATAMIGMIALAGIVTRNSTILVDFIEQALHRGRSLEAAVIESCAIRLRPIFLTAGAAMLASLPITIDPIFSGLGWSIIFGLLASTVFTLFVVPITYALVFGRRNNASHIAG